MYISVPASSAISKVNLPLAFLALSEPIFISWAIFRDHCWSNTVGDTVNVSRKDKFSMTESKLFLSLNVSHFHETESSQYSMSWRAATMAGYKFTKTSKTSWCSTHLVLQRGSTCFYVTSGHSSLQPFYLVSFHV